MALSIHEPLSLTDEEFAVLGQLLESERARLLVEIRHTDHRTYRDALRSRLAIVEGLAARCPAPEKGGGKL
jgi:hypothetical protein